jgi:hypothetical protein
MHPPAAHHRHGWRVKQVPLDQLRDQLDHFQLVLCHNPISKKGVPTICHFFLDNSVLSAKDGVVGLVDLNLKALHHLLLHRRRAHLGTDHDVVD